MKYCPYCKDEHSTEVFFKDRSRSDGLTKYCKVYFSDRGRRIGRERSGANTTPNRRGKKKCASCGTKKSRKSDFFRNKYNIDGLMSECKACSKDRNTTWKARNRKQVNSNARAYYAKDPAKYKSATRRSRRLRLYGVTEEKFLEMVESQGGACAICGQTEARLNAGKKFFVVDHDHATGKVRGVLCTSCNLAVGNVKDSVACAEALVRYLCTHQSVTVERA